jgi:hypothetical protein
MPLMSEASHAANRIYASPIPIEWNADLPIYASEAALRNVSDDFGWFGGTDDSGALRCILPYTILHKASIRMARFRVGIVSVGRELSIPEEKSFLHSVVERLRSMGVGMVIPATANTIFRTYPDGAVAAPYGSLVIDLCQPEETLWDNLHSKHRNGVRNAQRKGVEIRASTEYIDIAHETIRATLWRSRMRFMKPESFRRFVDSFGANIRILIAFHQNTVQGCAVVPFSNYSAYYVYGGSAPAPVTGAMNLLQWEAIRTLRDLGVKRYDFVGVRINPEKGSKQEGLMMFKQRFGGRLHAGYMWKLSLKPISSVIYRLATKLLISGGGDIVDIERRRAGIVHE